MFERFCYLLSHLNEEQQQLILDLSSRYIWLPFAQYQSKIINLLKSVDNKITSSAEQIILFPIMKVGDEKKTKSGHFMLYQIRGILPSLSQYEDIKIIEKESFESIKEEVFELKPNSFIFLLDDYLGTGTTLSETIEELQKNKTIHSSQIVVLSIAAQRESINLLKDLHIIHYNEIESLKGISDYYDGDELQKNKELMESIEALIPKNTFQFGYKNSEALITLMRTPNNTFPIFWNNHQINKEEFKAPFARF